MTIKKVRRNIPEKREDRNDRFRVNYGNKSAFDLLEVEIVRIKTNELQTFTFKSAQLPENNSIHFSTAIENEKLIVQWDKAVK